MRDNCDVCGAPAKHVHFGGFTCSSCKSFFRRVIQTEKEAALRCFSSGKCSITTENRRTCPFCRFEKCKAVGMQPSWVMSKEERSKMKVRRELTNAIRIGVKTSTDSDQEVETTVDSGGNQVKRETEIKTPDVANAAVVERKTETDVRSNDSYEWPKVDHDYCAKITEHDRFSLNGVGTNISDVICRKPFTSSHHTAIYSSASRKDVTHDTSSCNYDVCRATTKDGWRGRSYCWNREKVCSSHHQNCLDPDERLLLKVIKSLIPKRTLCHMRHRSLWHP